MNICSDTEFNPSDFWDPNWSNPGDKQKVLDTNIGSLTVLDRMTGFGNGIRDIETGFRDEKNRFWLASGNIDVRESGSKTIGEAIEWVKSRANTCVPRYEQ